MEAIALGFVLRYAKFSKIINTLLAIILLIVGVSIGLSAPMLGISVGTWNIIVFIYILIASVVPVWALLQPRDYLNSYLLIFMIIAAVAGIIVANPDVNINAFNGFYVDGMGSMFPILFVTIACGAVSGFHSLVSSGTSSKQIKNEKNMLPVSFGSMLLESLLAVISLIVVASFVGGTTGAAELGYTTPSLIFAGGIAGFLEVLGLPYTVVFTLINLAVSAFALTSLDSVARIGRLSFQELFLTTNIEDDKMEPWRKIVTNKYFATALTLILAYMLAQVGYANIWPLFGSANQLLSALALIACAVFFKKTNRNGKMLWIPMVIMLSVTLSALTLTIYSKITALATGTSATISGDALQLAFAIALFVLGIIVAIKGFLKLTEK